LCIASTSKTYLVFLLRVTELHTNHIMPDNMYGFSKMPVSKSAKPYNVY
jgi:hypothetical protein